MKIFEPDPFVCHDEQGHLLGEYDGSGNLIQETVWLEDLPVATLRPNGTGNPVPVAIYYVHADHLGSPRAVTRPSDNALMWQWDNIDPFGANTPNESPTGLGSFKYAMRFPGQYYDAETQTHYNYYRDYDPTIGRYGQSDPIGLKGGINTYGYVNSSPTSQVDPTGLIIYVPGPRIPCPGCDEWKSKPPGRCTWARHDELKANQETECGKTYGCESRMSCRDIAERVYQGYACLQARLNLMNECFGGGDQTHQEEVMRVLDAISGCLDAAKKAKCC